MTEKSAPFEIIGTTICWIKNTLIVISVDKEETQND